MSGELGDSPVEGFRLEVPEGVKEERFHGSFARANLVGS